MGVRKALEAPIATAMRNASGLTPSCVATVTAIGAIRDKAYLRRSILDPNADIGEDFEADMMPADYGMQMYAAELEMLVDYLAGLK